MSIVKNILIVLFLFHVGVPPAVGEVLLSSVSNEYGAGTSLQRKIQYSYTLTNTTNRIVPAVDFWTYIPVNTSSDQQVPALKASRAGEILEDDLGNRILHFSLNNIPPFSEQIITIETELILSSGGTPVQIKNIQRYLSPEPFIESDHPEIVDHARKLTMTKTIATARNIFDWVSSQIEYEGYRFTTRGALYTLRHKKGDCTEFASLFVAFCRAAGIPARLVQGYVVDTDTVLNPADYHDWAEFYIAGSWRVADPQTKVFMENENQYIAMRLVGESSRNPLNKRSRYMLTGEGMQVRMN